MPLKAYDAMTMAEVKPGDTIRSLSAGMEYTFREAIRATEAGRDGSIQVDGRPGRVHYHAGLFGLHVVSVKDNEPAASSGQSEPAPAQRDLRAILADLDGAAEAGQAYESPDLYHELEDVVRAQLTQVRGGTEALAAEADRIARTTAPPVPGVTQNTGHVVYAVLDHRPASPGSLESWLVAAADDRGEHVTWTAYASDDGSGTLHYEGGHYHGPGQGADDEALADLAERARVFRALDRLSAGIATREAFQESHAKVMDELSGIYGVGKARIRAGLLEAAALGYARVSWHDGGNRKDYGIRYDRYRCTFSWAREN